MKIRETEYWEEIERLARAALEEERLHGRDADDALWGFIDSHSWVSYTDLALQVPRFNGTHKDDALEALDEVLSTIAFVCLLGDARKRLEELRLESEEEA